ncbi:branched-chain-amino-acid transaminase [Puniceicoccus vermicola]|uniref:Branched-chain-amino-acid aminotransferase n=1 Tax=Puniceicoccus vermicola TaxID=388746 RepID=A0A7X1B270_9BACT|nr:branched-chain-amino-acid transaminase [Puniceicoccus vermicola]MBC2604261.1 branched-chain-amino-acid transaminase [Puniceicoccus vermicola]
MKVYLNGEFVEKEDAKVSVFDHGFLYGDGVFEGIRLYSGNIFKLEEHLIRLEQSAKALLLDMPVTRDEMRELVCESCRVNGLTDGYIRLIVTRGVGSLGLSPKGCGPSGLVIIADTIELFPKRFYEEGLKIVTVPTRRLGAASLPPMVKSLNYLNNILAKIEAQASGHLEALMLNDQGYVAECSGDNVFIIQGDTLVTPHTASGSLRGITRDAVLEIAEKSGMKVEKKNLTRYDIWVSDECFVSGTAAEIVPVVEVDARVIGDGRPGPKTLKLLEKYKEQVSGDGTRI